MNTTMFVGHYRESSRIRGREVTALQIGIACPNKNYTDAAYTGSFQNVHWLGQSTLSCETCAMVSSWRQAHDIPNDMTHSGVLPPEMFSEDREVIRVTEQLQAMHEALT